MKKRLAKKLFKTNRGYLIPNNILVKLIKKESLKRTALGCNIFFDGKKYGDIIYDELENMINFYLDLLKGIPSRNTNPGLEGLISEIKFGTNVVQNNPYKIIK